VKTIQHLKITNLWGIREFSLEPGAMTVIAGGNGTGKTSVLRSIQAAFEGFDGVCVRQGSERGEVLIDLGDIVITRTQTQGGKYLKVTDAKGDTLAKPQTVLNGLMGASAGHGLRFNPVQFLTADASQVSGTKFLL